MFFFLGMLTGQRTSNAMLLLMRIPTTSWCVTWRTRCLVWRNCFVPRAWETSWIVSLMLAQQVIIGCSWLHSQMSVSQMACHCIHSIVFLSNFIIFLISSRRKIYTFFLSFYCCWPLTLFISSCFPLVDPMGDDYPGSGIKCVYMCASSDSFLLALLKLAYIAYLEWSAFVVCLPLALHVFAGELNA